MKNWLTLLMITVVFLAVPALGRQNQADPAKTENIRHLLQLTKGDNIRQVMMDQITAALKPLFAASPGDLQAQKILSRLSDLVLEEFKTIDFNATTIALYDKYFTNEEILGMIRFYETPLGKKTIEVMPNLVQESMMRGQEQGEQAAQRALARVTEEFPELKNAFQGLSPQNNAR